MTRDEAAAYLDGREYRDEVSDSYHRSLAAAGLVAVFGGSDDLIYFAGAINDELGAYRGRIFHVTRGGDVWSARDVREGSVTEAASGLITAIWSRDGISWQYETQIPHATFRIMEDGEIYCRGLVFALADLPEA